MFAHVSLLYSSDCFCSTHSYSVEFSPLTDAENREFRNKTPIGQKNKTPCTWESVVTPMFFHFKSLIHYSSNTILHRSHLVFLGVSFLKMSH